MNEVQDLDFASDFLTYYDKVGIYDEFDKTTQKMKTSSGVYVLVQKARKLLPERMKGGEAAAHNAQVEPAVVEAIAEKTDRVVNAQKIFAARMSKNGGAAGLVQQLAEAIETQDNDSMVRTTQNILALAKALQGDTNVFNIEEAK